MSIYSGGLVFTPNSRFSRSRFESQERFALRSARTSILVPLGWGRISSSSIVWQGDTFTRLHSQGWRSWKVCPTVTADRLDPSFAAGMETYSLFEIARASKDTQNLCTHSFAHFCNWLFFGCSCPRCIRPCKRLYCAIWPNLLPAMRLKSSLSTASGLVLFKLAWTTDLALSALVPTCSLLAKVYKMEPTPTMPLCRLNTCVICWLRYSLAILTDMKCVRFCANLARVVCNFSYIFFVCFVCV